MKVYVDNPDIYIEPHSILTERWNGFVVPVVSYDQYSEFVHAMQTAGVDGWDVNHLSEEWLPEGAHGMGHFNEGSGETDWWDSVGTDDNGNHLYAMWNITWDFEDNT